MFKTVGVEPARFGTERRGFHVEFRGRSNNVQQKHAPTSMSRLRAIISWLDGKKMYDPVEHVPPCDPIAEINHD